MQGHKQSWSSFLLGIRIPRLICWCHSFRSRVPLFCLSFLDDWSHLHSTNDSLPSCGYPVSAKGTKEADSISLLYTGSGQRPYRSIPLIRHWLELSHKILTLQLLFQYTKGEKDVGTTRRLHHNVGWSSPFRCVTYAHGHTRVRL